MFFLVVIVCSMLVFQHPGMDFSGASITGNYAGGGPELPS